MKSTIIITLLLAVLVIGAVAILWILGVGSFDQLSETAGKTIGVVVVLAAVGVAIGAIARLGRPKGGPPAV